MNVRRTVAALVHGLRSRVREAAVHVDEQLHLCSFNEASKMDMTFVVEDKDQRGDEDQRERARDLIGRAALGPIFLALVDRQGSPEFARDGAIFAVDFDHEFFGTIKAGKRSGVSVKLPR
jgi:hypothetical protein